ncbi:MAG: hypothetical protein JJU37_05950 [Balneolaceae bacterium]|nr:hypothetical protein [Balneolaceae bacterium]
MKKLKKPLMILSVVLFSIGCMSESNKSSEPKSPDLFTPDSVITESYTLYLNEIS